MKDFSGKKWPKFASFEFFLFKLPNLYNNDVPKHPSLAKTRSQNLPFWAKTRSQNLPFLVKTRSQNGVEIERERERARREGSEEGRCCSDGASAGAAASFTVQARPSPVYCRRKKCLPPRHVIVLLGFFLEIFREVLSLLLCLGFFSGGT